MRGTCSKNYGSYQRGCRCDDCKADNKRYMDDWHARNPSKRKKYERRRCDQGPRIKTPEQRRDARLRLRYDMSFEEFDYILESQLIACASCGAEQPRTRKFWQVEHCHRTDKIRGITCPRCNRAIAQLGDHASAVAVMCTRFLAYLAVSGDVLTNDEVGLVIEAIKNRKECSLASARETTDPERPARKRHQESR